MFPPLDPAVILGELSEPGREALLALSLSGRVDSTNSAVLQLSAFERHAHAWLAEHQQAGRGRRGRRWHSPPGGNIYLSLGWELPAGVAGISGLPLAVGVMAARAVQRAGVSALRIKWPNDLQVGGRKLGGILIESRTLADGAIFVAAGIGLNVRMPRGTGEEEDIEQPWTDLWSNCAPVASGPAGDRSCDRDWEGKTIPVGERRTNLRNRLAGWLIDELVTGLPVFELKGFAAFQPDWDGIDALRGRRVRVELPEGALLGEAQGVAEDGGLRVRVDDPGREAAWHTFYAGDVSLRLE